MDWAKIRETATDLEVQSGSSETWGLSPIRPAGMPEPATEEELLALLKKYPRCDYYHELWEQHLQRLEADFYDSYARLKARRKDQHPR